MASKDESLNSITLKGTLISELKVTDIKRELEKRGLPKGGTKQQLAERLQAQLLLEKLQQDAAQSSGDELEGKVPNIALQQDNKAGQSEFVRQYLEQQQRNLEIQMEVKKQVEEERKRKSADESSADEANPTGSQAHNDPDLESPKKFKDDSSNAPAKSKEVQKMPKPARKSSRNASKGENGQESDLVKDRSRSPTPDNERLRERTRSGSSSSSRSPTPEKYTRSRRGRQARGRASKRGGGRRRSNYAAKSRSSSSSSEEAIPKKKQRSTNSVSSRSRSRSPQIVSPEATRRSSRRVGVSRTTPDHPLDDSEDRSGSRGRKIEKEVSPEPVTPPATKRQKISEDEKPIEAAVETKSIEETVVPVTQEDPPTSEIIDRHVGEESQKPVESTESIPADSVSTDSPTKDAVVEKSAETLVSENESTDKEDVSMQVDVKLSDTDTSLNNNELSSNDVVPIIESASVATESHSGENECLSEKAQEIVSLKVVSEFQPIDKESETAAESTNVDIEKVSELQPIPHESETTVESNKVDDEKVSELQPIPHESETSVESYKVDDEKIGCHGDNETNGRKLSKSPAQKSPRHSRSSSSSSSSSGSRTRPKSASKPKTARSRSSSSSSSQSRSRSRSSSSRSSSSDSSGRHGREALQRKSLKKSPSPRKDVMKAEQAGDRSGNDSQISEVTKHDGDSQLITDVETNEPTGIIDQQAESVKESDKDDLVQKTDTKTVPDDVVVQSGKDKETEKEETALKKDKTAKKRKWNSKTSKAAKPVKRTTSLEISSDSLKNLIGDVKLTETVFDMDTEVVNTLDYDDHEEDRRDVRMKRTVVQSPHSEEVKQEITEERNPTEDIRVMEPRDEESKQEDQLTAESDKKIIRLAGVKEEEKNKKKKLKKKKDEEEKVLKEDKTADKENKERVFASTRPTKPLLPAVDEPEPMPGQQSPARNPPDRVIRIAGLVRPFTLGQLKELLKRSGELDDEYFWINDIKSHCLAAYKSVEDAVKARAALHRTRWPQSNPKILIVDFATVEDVKHRKAEGDVPLPALAKKPIEAKKQVEQKEEEEKERRLKSREIREKEREEKEKEKREEKDRPRKREAERKNPIREWDRDKVQQLSKSRSRSKERPRRSRSRSLDKGQRKRRDPSREKKEDEKRKDKKLKETKTEEEPPAKLLDDLFRKTKAVPCIYWLPLTEEQAAQRVLKKQELEKERQKRIAAAEEREKEELKRREAARLERLRERERERSRERESRRQDRSRSSRSDSRSRSRRRR